MGAIMCNWCAISLSLTNNNRNTDPHVRLGTRGSPLALWQARWVAEALCLPGSRRRQAQLPALYRAFEVRDIRGNVETRLRKMRQGKVDGVVLAAAGPIRLGLQQVVYLPSADNCDRPLPSRLRGVNEPVISLRIGFSGPRSALFAFS
jgi:hypothetical protein